MHRTIDSIIQSIPLDDDDCIDLATYVPNHLYVPGGSFYVQAGGVVFSFHKYFFDRDSQWWQQRDRIFYPVGVTIPGHNLTHPVILPPIISAKAFASLLWVIYNVRYGTHITTKEEWSSILVAAVALGFEQIQELVEFKWNVADRKEARAEESQSLGL
jgi:hypothetical protein